MRPRARYGTDDLRATTQTTTNGTIGTKAGDRDLENGYHRNIDEVNVTYENSSKAIASRVAILSVAAVCSFAVFGETQRSYVSGGTKTEIDLSECKLCCCTCKRAGDY
jgi:hypothetical protein